MYRPYKDDIVTVVLNLPMKRRLQQMQIAHNASDLSCCYTLREQ